MNNQKREDGKKNYINVKRIVKFRSLIENRKLFNVSPTERQTKCMRVSRIICVDLTVYGEFAS